MPRLSEKFRKMQEEKKKLRVLSKAAGKKEEVKGEEKKVAAAHQDKKLGEDKKHFFGKKAAGKNKEVPKNEGKHPAEKKEDKSRTGGAKGKEKPKKKSFYEQKKFLNDFVKKAGIEFNFDEINKKILSVTGAAIGIGTLYLIVKFIISKTFITDALAFLFSLWVFGTFVVFFGIWLIFLVYVDYQIMQRKKQIEDVFPDFLQLTAANINAGMPVDRALWYAIRPKFGVLAKEMEDAAKATMIGGRLDRALLDFSEKYDSPNIKRALNLLLEGLESGSEIGDLLTRIATNMRDTQIIRKEMASNVTTYVIFILFASLGAAPFLFGLTTQLIVIMNSIFANINLGDTGSFGGVGGFVIGGSQGISVTDYQYFAIVSVIMSAVFSAILTSVITKGDTKESLKQIPLYILIGLAVYFISFKALNLLLGGFF